MSWINLINYINFIFVNRECRILKIQAFIPPYLQCINIEMVIILNGFKSNIKLPVNILIHYNKFNRENLQNKKKDKKTDDMWLKEVHLWIIHLM